MSGWQDVALVLAGSVGPAGVAILTIRSDRRKDHTHWLREQDARRHDTYSRFLAACTTVVADWSDVALMPPRSPEEGRLMDERRDVHYDGLNLLAAMIRLTAAPVVAREAERLLGVVRDARDVGQELAAETDRAAAEAGWRDVDARFAEARAAFVAAGRRSEA